MSTDASPSSALETLAHEYARCWAHGGDARWLVHAWRTLAVVGAVPEELPARGVAAADARIRLAALASFSALFHQVVDGDPDGPEPPELVGGPHGLVEAEVTAWMAEHGLQTMAQLLEQSTDHDDSAPDTVPWGLDPSDVESCLDAVAGEMLRAYAALRPHAELFAELWAQRWPLEPTEQDAGECSRYPLTGAQLEAALNPFSVDAATAHDWLEQHLAALGS
ncbi:hypothetical protein [Brachybacterium sp. J153]|uniref:hypothetical protein n=1 Tax=Brachybacterium sp. J153 TaxID=3116488 RepID=UPI002E78355A|nr:hypothetical protein [Brachybacterium sp. J153]MEE1617230.1 hypothetical protein [Brachybacterium sp. J153]